jgi:PAS domain S-box-containing protein
LLGLTGVTIRARQRLAEHARVLERRVAERTAELTRDVAQRRLAEMEAKKGRERLAKVFQASPSLMGIVSYPDGCFLEVNRCFTETLGYTEAEMQGRTGSEVGIWAREDQRDAMWADLKDEAPVRNRELLIRAKSGRMHTVLASVDRIELGGGPALLFAASDITDRVRIERRRATEHAVARVLAEARSLAEAISAVLRAISEAEGWALAELWEVDGAAERLQRVAVWHGGDERFAEITAQGGALKFGPGEVLQGIVWQLAVPVFVGDLANDVRFRRSEAASRAGLVAGVGFPIRAAGRVMGVLILLADRAVNPGQDFEEVLGAVGSQIGQFIARSRARDELERFVSMSPTVLYVLQLGQAGLEPSWISSNVSSMVGYRSEECLTSDWWARHVHPDDLKRTMDAQPKPYQIDHQVLEYRFRRKDGVYIWIRDEKRLVRDAQGRPKEVVGAWADVSERVALEARLTQAQKMEAIGLLSGGIAHDFNNILGAILGNAQLARMDVAADHPAAESLDAILQATHRAKSVVRQILDFARQESQELRRLDLGPVVEESVRLLRATLPAEVDLVFEVAKELPSVLADASQIQQAMMNLGTNAWHALGGQSGRVEVTLTAERVESATVKRHADLRVGWYVRLRVRDTGSGMTQETLEKIFMPFFTTKAPGTGTGLGLSVVHGIVRSHRGAVLVTSAPGEGSTFDLFFPAASERATEVAAQPGVGAPKGGSERILLLDDKELIVRSCSRALTRLGYQVKSFTDGASALAEIHGNTQGFDLVITDLSMPGISGLEIAKIIQKLRPDLPVVLSSGMVPTEMQNELTAAGIHDVLRKPFTFEELGETVGRALRRNVHESSTT